MYASGHMYAFSSLDGILPLPVSINNRGRNKSSLSSISEKAHPLGLVLSLIFHVLISETTYRI
jgi:hypothetical protein